MRSAASGALIGLTLAAPLAALWYLAWRLGLAVFAPFTLFDALARALPGGLVTAGIDLLVTVLRALGPGGVAELAKPAEQGLALVLFGLVLGLAGGAYAAIASRPGPAGGGLLGALLAVAGVGFALAVRAEMPAAGPAEALAVLLGLGLWGAGLGASLATLRALARRAAIPGEARAARLDRRRFLVRLGGSAALVTVAGTALGALRTGGEGRERAERGAPWSARNPLPNQGASPAPAPGTRDELTPLDDHYRIDINLVPPDVDASAWQLVVHGLVERPARLSLPELEAYEATDLFVTLSCISNPVGGDLISTQRWTGVSLRRVLEDVSPDPEASHALIRSVDGFYEVVDLGLVRADPRVMLCYAWDGLPLPRAHGHPLRIYIPDVYGMKQPKWIESIELLDAWQAGYWVARGWDREARMKATSVIDTVAVEAAYTGPDGALMVPVGGVAHVGARGVSAVEVRVDDGPWEAAEVREPLAETTWALWRFDWPYRPGEHTFTVRCRDGRGALQVMESTPVRPDGATGLHERTRHLPRT